MKFLLLHWYSRFALLLVAALAACAPVQFATGNYSETHGPGVIMWTGTELRLAGDYTFGYSYWSDDVSSGRYGAGTWRVVGKKLQLSFAAQPARVPTVVARPLASGTDSLVLTFAVAGRGTYEGAQATALPGVSVVAYCTNGQVIAAASTDTQGRTTLRLPHATQAQRLLVQGIGFVEWRQECPVRSTAYQLELPANAGTPYAAGTCKEFRVLCHTDTTLVLGQGPQVTTLRRQPPAP